jgi:alpha-L-fucosidase
MKKNINRLSLLILLGTFSLCLVPGALAAVKPESDAEFDQRMQWFKDAEFGLFIHYGVYSILGGEWKGKEVWGYAEWAQRKMEIPAEEYVSLAADFKPENLDADLWVKTAKDAGMEYMVITTKHHDGFCLWDSAETDFDLGEATEFDRDILGELRDACVKYDVKFGLYYSIIDWHHSSQSETFLTTEDITDKAGYVTFMKAQLKELIDNYDPAILWFDGDWMDWWTMDDGLDLYNYLRELSPDVIINNRIAERALFKKDFGTPENMTPGSPLDYLWEACWTINNSWGYKKMDTNWKSSEVLIQKQIDINTKGGNLLLNVGPKPDGSWPEGCAERLLAMGEWSRAYGDTVRESEPVYLPMQAWGRMARVKGSTSEKGELYAYVFDWPENGELKILGVDFGALSASTYEGESLPVSACENGMKIDLSSATEEAGATVLRLKYCCGLAPLEIDGKPWSNELVLRGDELILRADSAELTGDKIELVDEIYLDFGEDVDAVASWDLNVPFPGKYKVQLYYSCKREDMSDKRSSALLSVRGQQLEIDLEPTHGLSDYKLLDLGVVDLDQVGTTTCAIAIGKKETKSSFHLKTALFVPVSE